MPDKGSLARWNSTKGVEKTQEEHGGRKFHEVFFHGEAFDTGQTKVEEDQQSEGVCFPGLGEALQDSTLVERLSYIGF